MALDTFVTLDEIRNDIVIAGSSDDVTRALLQLIGWLERREHFTSERETQLRQLVREAYSLLHNPESDVDLREWLRTAAPFVRS